MADKRLFHERLLAGFNIKVSQQFHWIITYYFQIFLYFIIFSFCLLILDERVSRFEIISETFLTY